MIKRSPASRECASDDVAAWLFDYAHSLCAGVTHTSVSRVDSTSTGADASSAD